MLDDTIKLKYKTMQLMCTTECKNVDLHNHNEFEILLITDGNPLITVKDRTYNAKNNDFILINPMEIHSVNSNDKTYKLNCICFDLSVIPDKNTVDKLKNDSIQIKHYIDSSKYNNSYLKDLFLKIVTTYNSANEWSDSKICAYLILFFSHLFENEFLIQKTKESKASVFCTEVLSYIAENYSQDISSKSAAKELAYSHGYFCRKFMKNFGKSFSRYLTMYRISMAKILLESKKQSISEIAYSCGFSSADYFSKCFKQLVGIVPSEYK